MRNAEVFTAVSTTYDLAKYCKYCTAQVYVKVIVRHLISVVLVFPAPGAVNVAEGAFSEPSRPVSKPLKWFQKLLELSCNWCRCS